MTQERKRKLNIIDFVILLAIVAVLAAVVYRVFLRPDTQDAVRVRYVLEVPQIQTEFCSKVGSEDMVFYEDSATDFGVVTATSTAPAYFKGTDREGNPVYTEMEDYSILYITIEADALQSSTGYEISGYAIHAGDTLTVQFPGLYCEAQCIGIDVIE